MGIRKEIRAKRDTETLKEDGREDRRGRRCCYELSSINQGTAEMEIRVTSAVKRGQPSVTERIAVESFNR